MRLTWPLIGRSKELRLIDAALTDRHSSGIVVCGPAGVGKTRVVREALSAAEAGGYAVRRIVGSASARAIPLGALATWANQDSSPGLSLVRGVIESLTATAAGRPVVLSVDDAPMLDDLTTFVLHQIIQQGVAKVVLTVRDSEPIPYATQELWRTGQFDRLDLESLSRDDTTAMVSAAVGGPVDPYATQRLWEVTRGNPLYVRNIVEHEAARERLVLRKGMWGWADESFVVPPSLIESVEARIGDLSGPVADVVDALAVSEPLDLASLTNITSAAAVEEADVRGLITLDPVDGGMEVRMAHPVYGEVRRNRAASTRLRRLRGVVAAELASRETDDDPRVVMRRASLTLESDLTPDPQLLVRGAERAVSTGDLMLAERLSTAADRLDGSPEAKDVLAHTFSLTGRAEEADRLIADMDTRTWSDAERAARDFKRAGLRLFALSDPVGAKKLIDEASDPTPSGTAAKIIAAFHAYYAAAMGEASTFQELMASFTLDDLPDIVVGHSAHLGSTILGTAGRTADAIALAQAGRLRVAKSLDSAIARYGIGDGQLRALILAGRISEASELTERLRIDALEVPRISDLLADALSIRATLAVGHVQAVCAMAQPVVTIFSFAGDEVGMAYHFLLMQTTAQAMSGSTGKAVASLSALDQSRHPAWRCLDFEYAVAKAWVAACQGAASDAVATVLDAAAEAGARGQFAAEVFCLQTAAQFGDHSRVTRLHELDKLVEGPRVGVVRRFADALRAEDGAELASVSRDFEDLGDLVAAADASAYAAIMYRRVGQRGSALGAVARSDSLTHRCGIDTPALRQAAEPIPLTDREREIARLIGQGFSSRDVAEKLTLSVRTVEGHIYRAMTKTGTTTRAELATLLTDRPRDEG